MRWFYSVIMPCFILGLAGCGGSNKDKIIGVWEVAKSGSGAPAGATIEFTKDGKMKMTVSMNGKEMSMEGTYSVEGDKLTATAGPKGEKDTATIKKLTDSELVIEDSKGKTDELKKKK